MIVLPDVSRCAAIIILEDANEDQLADGSIFLSNILIYVRMGVSMIRGSSALSMPLFISCVACVPMEQASLTYTSKTSMGVGVAVGTQETPGIDVNIGFKENNVALVPVAVAKYCYKATAAQCQDIIYKMELISGGKLDEIASLPIQKRNSEINDELDSLIQQQRIDTERLASLRTGLALNEAADLAEIRLKELSATLVAPAAATPPPGGDFEETEAGTADVATDEAAPSVEESPEIKARRAELTETLRQRPTNFDAATARREVATLEAAQVSRSAKMDAFRQEQSQLTKRLASDVNSNRKDSYSVYGKFSGSAGGNVERTGSSGGASPTAGASLTAGKVFATGIAAQNLTEFAATVDCIANIGVLAAMMPDGKDDAKAALLATAGDVCKPKAKTES